jgi:hypothetical protein
VELDIDKNMFAACYSSFETEVVDGVLIMQIYGIFTANTGVARTSLVLPDRT